MPPRRLRDDRLVGRLKNDRRNRMRAAVQARETRKAGTKTWKHTRATGSALIRAQPLTSQLRRRCVDPARGSKSAGCSLTSAFARRNNVGGRIMIDNVRGGALANDIRGEQTLNIGKAGLVAPKIAPSPR